MAQVFKFVTIKIFLNHEKFIFCIISCSQDADLSSSSLDGSEIEFRTDGCAAISVVGIPTSISPCPGGCAWTVTVPFNGLDQITLVQDEINLIGFIVGNNVVFEVSICDGSTSTEIAIYEGGVLCCTTTLYCGNPLKCDEELMQVEVAPTNEITGCCRVAVNVEAGYVPLANGQQLLSNGSGFYYVLCGGEGVTIDLQNNVGMYVCQSGPFYCN